MPACKVGQVFRLNLKCIHKKSRVTGHSKYENLARIHRRQNGVQGPLAAADDDGGSINAYGKLAMLESGGTSSNV